MRGDVAIFTDQGNGTTQEDYRVSVAAIDTTSGTEMWLASFPPCGFTNDTRNSMTGADEHFVVCSVTGTRPTPARTGDQRPHIPTWTEPGFQPIGLAGPRIIGARITEPYETSGPLHVLAVDTLAPAWTRDDLDDPATKLVTPSVVQAPGDKPLSSAGRPELLRRRTAPVDPRAGPSTSNGPCRRRVSWCGCQLGRPRRGRARRGQYDGDRHGHGSDQT
jgi:hypothetical protein